MNKTILLLLSICLVAGTLSSINHKSIFGFSSQNPPMSRDRTWKMTEKITDNWNGASWDQTEKQVYYYNPTYFARLDSGYVYSWNVPQCNWIPSFKLVYTYTPNQEYISYAEYSIVSDLNNEPVRRLYATYDGQNRLTLFRVNVLDIDTSQWFDTDRIHIQYGLGTSFQIIAWWTDDEDNPSGYSYERDEFDDYGRILTSSEQTSLDSLNWENNYQYNYTYHPHDTMTGSQLISNIAHQVVIRDLVYDGIDVGMVTETLGKSWSNSATWVEDYLNTYTYDDGDKLIGVLDQSWFANSWNNENNSIYSYDDNGNMQQMIYLSPAYPTGWENTNRDTYTWSQITANEDNVIPAVSAMEIKAYPNPFINNVEMQIVSKGNELVSVDIYNLKGQIVKSFDANPNQKFSWDGRNIQNQIVSPGVYFFKATQGKSLVTKKVLRMI